MPLLLKFIMQRRTKTPHDQMTPRKKRLKVAMMQPRRTTKLQLMEELEVPMLIKRKKREMHLMPLQRSLLVLQPRSVLSTEVERPELRSKKREPA